MYIMLYEPTNITPSLMSQNGTIDVVDDVNISWQVNGTSALKMFQIDMYDSGLQEIIYSTGVVSDYAYSPQQKLPFYGKNRLGEYIQFIYSPSTQWADWGMTNGNNYDYYITQFYSENNVIAALALQVALTVGETYYFSYEYNSQTFYVQFVNVDNTFFANGATIYFNHTASKGWVCFGANNRIFYNLTFAVTTVEPTSGASLGAGNLLTANSTGRDALFYQSDFVIQTASNAIISRSTPQLAINSVVSPIQTSTYLFNATYEQAQGDSITSVRWTLFNNSDLSEPIDDTGDIYTPVLEYEYGGFFGGETYLLKCEVQTLYGVTASAQIQFEVEFTEESYLGNFVINALCNDDGNLLSWDSVEVINGVATPEDGYSINGEELTLNDDATITWSQKQNSDGTTEQLNFTSPWTSVWAGDIQPLASTAYIEDVHSINPQTDIRAIAFSPAGNLFVMTDNDDKTVSVYSIGGNSSIWLYDLEVNYPNGGNISCAAFSPDGSLLVVGYDYSIAGAYLYSVNGTQIEYIGSILRDGNNELNHVTGCCFSPDGNTLVICSSANNSIVGGGSPYAVSVFLVSGQTVRWLSNLHQENDEDYDRGAYCVAFSPDGTWLIVGGEFTGGAYLYQVDGTQFTWNSTIPGVSTTVPPEPSPTIDGTVYCCAFNSQSNGFVLGGDFTNYGYRYGLNSQGINSRGTIYKNGTQLLDGIIRTVSFSGTILFVGGEFTGKASIYYADASSVLWFKDLNLGQVGEISSDIYCASFNNSDLFLVIGGEDYAVSYYVTNLTTFGFIGLIGKPDYSTIGKIAFNPAGTLMVGTVKSLIYTVNGSFINAINTLQGGDNSQNVIFNNAGTILIETGNLIYLNIYTVTGETEITYSNRIVTPYNAMNRDTLRFTPSDDLFIAFSSVYSVSGTNFTKISNLSVNGTQIADSEVYSIDVSSSGNLLYVGLQNSPYARLFQINGQQFTFLTDIPNLSNSGRVGKFSPSGELLIIAEIGDAPDVHIYSVNGATANQIQTISYNGRINAIEFSHSGDFVVICGDFTEGAILYRVEGNQIAAASDISRYNENLSDVTSCAFTPDDKYLVVASNNNNIIVNVTKNQEEKTLEVINSNLSIQRSLNSIVLYNENTQICSANILTGQQGITDHIVIKLSPSTLSVYAFSNMQYVGVDSNNYSLLQPNLSTLELTGPQTSDYVLVIDGNGQNIQSFLDDYGFTPSWTSEDYNVNLLANFVHGIDGGIGTSLGTGFKIYRAEQGSSVLVPIATLPSTITQIKDYALKSGKSYVYYFYAYDSNDAFMGAITVEANGYIFNKFSLLATTYNSTDKCYHVEKEFLFSCNIQDMAISNNSNKNYTQNFTPYPTVLKSTANYASGTLQGLIGYVDNASKYWDSVELMGELNNLSTSSYTLFLRDTKGHLWMVDVGTVVQTPTQKTRTMQVTISLPWTEIGSADGISIIQTPNDSGWNYDYNVLDVRFTVIPETGELKVIYPYPYEGTKFAFNSKEGTLTAKTPLGITAAQLSLSEKADAPTSGQLIATTLHNISTEKNNIN